MSEKPRTMSQYNKEEEFDTESYVAGEDASAAPESEAKKRVKKPKLSAKHESLMVFGFWFVQQLGLEGEDLEFAHSILKLKDEAPVQIEYYSDFTDHAKVHKEELKLFTAVPKVRKARAPRKPKISAAAAELVESAQTGAEAKAPKKPRAPRKPKVVAEVVEPEEEEDVQPISLPVEEEEVQQVEENVVAEVVAPAKKGRKPKAASDNTKK